MISVELKGRLGNHLFQYATCRVIAEKNECDFTIPNGNFYGDKSVSGCWLGKKFFECSMGSQPYQKQKNIFSEGKNAYNDNILSIGDGTHLDGWWQSEKYFSDYEDKIREWFYIEKPDSPYLTEDYCIIHFRAQDGYLSENYTPSDNFFNDAKNYILDLKPNIKFVIITDNVKMAKNKFKNDIIISNDMKKDFSIILHAKYKIISNSSFSWWAAWLGTNNSKLVIAPNRWMNYNFNKTKDDIFYPSDIHSDKFKYV